MPEDKPIRVIERKLEEVAQKIQQLGEIKTYMENRIFLPVR